MVAVRHRRRWKKSGREGKWDGDLPVHGPDAIFVLYDFTFVACHLFRSFGVGVREKCGQTVHQLLEKKTRIH